MTATCQSNLLVGIIYSFILTNQASNQIHEKIKNEANKKLRSKQAYI